MQAGVSRHDLLGTAAACSMPKQLTPHLMAVALSSRRELCAGLQSTATTLPAPCTSRLRALQPPLVRVRQVSALLMLSTCRRSHRQVRRRSPPWRTASPPPAKPSRIYDAAEHEEGLLPAMLTRCQPGA